MKGEISSDYRLQELLAALNEGLLDVSFVESKLAERWGDQVDLVHYSDGKYGITVI